MRYQLSSPIKLIAFACITLCSSLSHASSEPEPLPEKIEYFSETIEYKINDTNSLRLTALAKDLGFSTGKDPQFLSSDFILFSPEFEKVIFVSANRRVNADYVGKSYALEDGVLFQLETGRQQLAIFFLNVEPELQSKVLSQLSDKNVSSRLIDFLYPMAYAEEVKTTGSQSSGQLASDLGDSFANCAGGMVDGVVDTYNTLFVDPVWNTYQKVKKARNVREFWRNEVAATRKAGDYVRLAVKNAVRSAKTSTAKEKARFACSFVSPGVAIGAAGKASKLVAAVGAKTTVQVGAKAKIVSLDASVKAAASEPFLPVSRLVPEVFSRDTFLSVIWNPKNGEMYFAPSKGAKFADNTDVPNPVIRNGGHVILAKRANRPRSDFYGGGIAFDNDKLIVTTTSRGLNGGGKGIMPERLQSQFAQRVADYTGRVTQIKGKPHLYQPAR